MKKSKVLVVILTFSAFMIERNTFGKEPKRIHSSTMRDTSFKGRPAESKTRETMHPTRFQSESSKVSEMRARQASRDPSRDISARRGDAKLGEMSQKASPPQTVVAPKKNVPGQSSQTFPESKPLPSSTSDRLKPQKDVPGGKSQTFPKTQPQAGITTKKELKPQAQQSASQSRIDEKTARQASKEKESRRVRSAETFAGIFGDSSDYWEPISEEDESEPSDVSSYETTVDEEPSVTTQPAPIFESHNDWAHSMYGTNDCFIDEEDRLICPSGSYMVKR